MRGLEPLHSVDSAHSLSLQFDARLETVEGILAVVQEWTVSQGMVSDDCLSVRLVLEELLINICFYAEIPSEACKVDLRLHVPQKDEAADTASHHGEYGKNSSGVSHEVVHILLRDNGKPFNPLTYQPDALGGIPDSKLGGVGLTLVRLLVARLDYQRKDSFNCLAFEIPFNSSSGEQRRLWRESSPPSSPKKLVNRWWALWSSNITLRQTVIFTLCTAVWIWSTLVLFLVLDAEQRHESAVALTRQAMHTQSVISSTFLQRVSGSLEAVAQRARSHVQQLSIDPDVVAHTLHQGADLHSLMAEIPVIGIVLGYEGSTWLYSLNNKEMQRETLERDLSPLVAPADKQGQWQSLLMQFPSGGQHATMLYAVPLTSSGNIANGWIGTIISMPWIANTLYSLAGFKDAVPLFLDATGQYIIFPVGRQLGQGPQNLREEAQVHTLPKLVALEKEILAGKSGLAGLSPILESAESPWPLPWDGPASLAYCPLRVSGWFLGLLVSSGELREGPQQPPFSIIVMAILGPLAVGLATWLVCSHTLRPLNALTVSLEHFANGELDSPFPKMQFPDEIGAILAAFERVRVTMKASFRNYVNSAAAQQRIQNELKLARDIQESMLPRVFPCVSWAEVHADIDMSHEVCGDLYDCFSVKGDGATRLYCLMGDVCGKGIPAAIIMSRTMSLARAFLLEGLSPAETLSRVNNALLRSDTSSMFVTLLVGVLEDDGTFCWASAGHPAPILGPEPLSVSAIASESVQGGEAKMPIAKEFSSAPAHELPWSNELVLGVRPEQRYSTFSWSLTSGQSLLLYTDGADEAQGASRDGKGKNDMYGVTRLTQEFDAACRAQEIAKPKDITAALRVDITRHMNGLPLVDDLSLMVVTYGGTKA